MKALGKTPRSAGTLQALGYLALAGALAGWAALRSIQEAGIYGPPLDDTFIYLQYARTAAQGHFLEYQAGAEPTRGATSLLYPLILAPFAHGLSLQGLVWAAWGLGALLLAGCATLAHRWAARSLGGGAGLAAGALTLVSGHFVWGAASGMDIGLFAFALLVSLAAQARYLDAPDPASGLRRLGALGVCLLFLSLARPEGMLLALLIAVAVPLASRAPNSRRARWATVIPPLAGIALTIGITLLALGHLGSNTLEAKAVWSEQRPDVRAAAIRRLPWVLGQDLLFVFSDFRSRAAGFGTRYLLCALLMGGAGLGVAAGFRRKSNTAYRTLLVVLAAGFLTGLIPVGYNTHHHRYQMPYLPLCAGLVTGGWWWATSGRGRRLRAPLMTVLVALMIPGLIHMMSLYGANAGNIREHQVRMGLWIRDNLPPNAVVAINDAGAIAYYGDRRLVDLVGLTTNGAALPNRAGPGSQFEWLASLPPGARPTHFAIFPDWYPYLKRTTLVGHKLLELTLSRNTISGSDKKAVYEANWDAVGWGDTPVARRPLIEEWGFAIVDAVDVADLTDERHHDYEVLGTWRSTLREFNYASDPRRLLIDGGRQPWRGERFRLACRPGEPAALVMRTEAYLGFALDVWIDGKPAGRWEIPAEPTRWSEPLFELPVGAPASNTVLVELRAVNEGRDAYSSYQYWLLQ